MAGPLAQRLEQSAHNRLVVGSNPTGPTTPNMALTLTKRVTAFLAVLLFTFGAGCSLPKTGSDSKDGFEKVAVSIRDALKGKSRESGSGFWIAYDGSQGESLSPSNLAVYLRAVNNTDRPVKVVNHSAQMQTNGTWVALTRIPFGRSHTPYFGFSPDALQPVTGPVSLEVNSEAAVLPKAALEGWALFEYPDHIKNAEESTVRVTVSTDSGETFTTEANKTVIGAMDRVPMDVGGRIDLSRLHVSWYSKK